MHTLKQLHRKITREWAIIFTCFILSGVCAGIYIGLVISARAILETIMPESVQKIISKELASIDDQTDGSLKEHDFSENKWFSDAYRKWYYSLSELEQNIIKFHDASLKRMVWLTVTGIGLVIIAFALREKTKSQKKLARQLRLMEHEEKRLSK
jgi:hypothetical protein